jgi:S-formylglutathione hydrolase FrmB
LINQWLNPPLIFAQEVIDVAPGKPAIIDATGMHFPRPISDIQPGRYILQAAARISKDHPVPGRGVGDLFSEPQTVDIFPNRSNIVSFQLDQVVKDRPFQETKRVKYAELVSPSLSKFHGREVKIRAGVVVPPDWDPHSARSYPVLYIIPGFGGSHTFAYNISRSFIPRGVDDNVLMIVLDPRCYRGHHVFADSETNGPWATALTEEFIPYVESTFPADGRSEHRYVTGVSSGGWSALWLQISYPALFNGCWSHCPDPVDFRDFQQVNLYKPGSNMFTDDEGGRRPLARRDGKPILEYERFVRREEVLAPGGQIRSFESVFSRRRPDGTPEPLFDVETGAVNLDVARSWEPFDIRLVLKKNWSRLGPALAGKLHIYAGEEDTFYLEGAVRLLKRALERLGSDAEVVIVPGMGHGEHREGKKGMFETISENFNRVASEAD